MAPIDDPAIASGLMPQFVERLDCVDVRQPTGAATAQRDGKGRRRDARCRGDFGQAHPPLRVVCGPRIITASLAVSSLLAAAF